MAAMRSLTEAAAEVASLVAVMEGSEDYLISGAGSKTVLDLLY